MTKWVENTLKNMTLEEKVGQIIVVGFWDLENNGEQIMERALKHHLGGFFHFTEHQDTVANFTSEIQKKSKIPMFVTSDHESGTGFYVKEGTSFPRPMARGYYGNTESEYKIAKSIAQEARAIGGNFTLSPVVDVNIHPLNPDVNIRAYSDDTDAVCKLSKGYIKGIQDHGVLATAKHFPGNGGTLMDQHISQAIIDYSKEDYEKIFLTPFQEAIKQGVAAIMVAHLEVPSLYEERHPKYQRHVPTSMSKEVITDLLKNKMGFEGIVMSDALDMGGVMGMYTRDEANIKALEAGTHLLLNFFPEDFEHDYYSILKAVKDGKLSRQRLDDAVRRVLRIKQKFGFDQGPNMPLSKEKRAKIFAPGKTDQACQDIAKKSITLLRNLDNVLPIQTVEGKTCKVLNVFSPENKVLEGQGVMQMKEIISQRLQERGAIVDTVEVVSDWPFSEMTKKYKTFINADFTFINMFIVPSYAIGTLLPNINAVRLFYMGILTQAKNVVITSFGDPWVMVNFTTAATHLCAFDNTLNTQEVVVKAMFGETPVTGRMPVSFKNIFQRGDGIDLIP